MKYPLSLLCDERSPARRSFADPVLRDDGRVLRAMLQAEDKQLPATSGHLAYSQGDLQPPMRRVVVSWMLEVTEEQNCEEEVFSLSVIYLDHVVSVLPVKKTVLQLAACACMFVASKFRETNHLSAWNLVVYTDCSITIEDLLSWELVVLKALKWNVSRVTPHDMLDHMLPYLPLTAEQRLVVRRHAVTFVVLCTTELEFSMTPASMMAAASIIAAANGLLGASWTHGRLVKLLHRITAIETDCLRNCYEQLEATFKDRIQCNTSDEIPSSSRDVGDDDEHQTPSTPTDVRDICLAVDGSNEQLS